MKLSGMLALWQGACPSQILHSKVVNATMQYFEMTWKNDVALVCVYSLQQMLSLQHGLASVRSVTSLQALVIWMHAQGTCCMPHSATYASR